MTYEKQLEALRNHALELGADRAVIVPAGQLVIRHSVWAKCFIPGCKYYGSSIMCPPHNPLRPEVTRAIVAEYEWALLFQLDVPVGDFVGKEWRKRHVSAEIRHKKMVAELEGHAFYSGFHLAMGFAAGECSLCLPQRPCAVLTGQPCRYPLRARPAMEACGFDVFAIAKRVGWRLVPIGDSSTPEQVPCASLIGLVLVV